MQDGVIPPLCGVSQPPVNTLSPLLEECVISTKNCDVLCEHHPCLHWEPATAGILKVHVQPLIMGHSSRTVEADKCTRGSVPYSVCLWTFLHGCYSMFKWVALVGLLQWLSVSVNA